MSLRNETRDESPPMLQPEIDHGQSYLDFTIVNCVLVSAFSPDEPDNLTDRTRTDLMLKHRKRRNLYFSSFDCGAPPFVWSSRVHCRPRDWPSFVVFLSPSGQIMGYNIELAAAISVSFPHSSEFIIQNLSLFSAS
jgi:hypothetical protein